MTPPTVSVIIPSYNRAPLLKEAIKSVLGQTVTDLEILVCDDGSTDNTKEVVEEFNDPRIFWLPDQNSGGPAVPRNRGIKAAKGDWLAFLDCDDLWKPSKLESQINALKKHKLLMSCTNAAVIKDDTIQPEPYFNSPSDKLLSFKRMLRVNKVICSSMIIHRSIPSLLGGFPEDKNFKAIEDYALWLSASMMGNIYYISAPLTIYRDEPEQSIRGEIKTTEQEKKNRILRETMRRTSLLPNLYKRVHYWVATSFYYLRKNNFCLGKRR